MKGKKLFFLLILVLLFIIISIFIIINNFNKNSSNENNSYLEYTPEEEISTKQLRETKVNLFFVDSENNLKSESKLIDSTLLIQNPYQKLIELLLNGPDSENLFTIFPENTKVISTQFENNCVTINFSNELLNFKDETQKFNIINSTLNTLTQLNEVTSIRFLINGEQSNIFGETYTRKNWYNLFFYHSNPLTNKKLYCTIR